MTLKILCLNPPAEKGFIRSGRWTRRTRANQNWYPIHLALLTGYLEKHDYNTGLLDASAQNMSYELTFHYIKEVLQPNIIFYYFCYDNMASDLDFADLLAKYSRVILVGPWSLCAPDALLKTKRINVCTYGEFEQTCLELLQNQHYPDIKGIIWRNHIDNTLHTNPPRPLCTSEELDDMPFVSSVYKDFLDLKLYRQTSLKFPFVDTLGARGCPPNYCTSTKTWDNCSFCVWTHAFQGKPSYRSRSIKNIISELWWIKNNLPEVKQIFFQDDTLPQHHAHDLSQSILDEKLNICWGGYSRAELDYDTLKLMKESGCRTLHVGFESPIQSNLDLIHKGITVEQMKEFALNIKKLNMMTFSTFMFFPWQTPAEIKFTVNWAKSARLKRVNFVQAQGYPNTPYFDTIKHLNNPTKITETPKHLMTFEEMKHWEQYAFKHFYLYNPHFWAQTLKSPREWGQVFADAKGLLSFLRS